MVNLLRYPERTKITTRIPRFSWIVNSSDTGAVQHGFQILVASSRAILTRDEGDLWDSGSPDIGKAWKIDASSTAVAYDGEALRSESVYVWKVRTWLSASDVGPWSEAQEFATGALTDAFTVDAYLPEIEAVRPSALVPLAPGRLFVDFGRAAFATVELTTDLDEETDITLHLGEVRRGPYAVDRSPRGSRRYRAVSVRLPAGRHTTRVEIPADARNTGAHSIHMPAELFEVMPFRYCEIEGAPATLGSADVVQLAVHYPFDETAASFTSSSPVLNDVWQMCRYTMKATSFVGYYVDGDRERIPYESDGYINQLSHYACDREYTMARRTLDYLIFRPTWPTEWYLYLVLAAWNDYLFTGDDRFIAERYDDLVPKLLTSLARTDGLISISNMTDELLEAIHFAGKSQELFKEGVRDIVDWPQAERDGFEMLPVNSVVNAMYYRALRCIARIAESLGRSADASRFARMAGVVREAFAVCLIDPATGLVVDGEGSAHSSLHANAFALAAGVLAEERVPAVVEHIQSRRMACSVYASQMLLESLYTAGEDAYALSLLTGTGMRSWAHMIYDVGTTISMEAWDDSIKPNQDWNHAWGAAPANIVPFGLMGVRPLAPGFAEVMIDPKPGSLSFAQSRVPTVRGTIAVRVSNEPGVPYVVAVEIPANVSATVGVPCPSGPPTVVVDGRVVHARREGGRCYVSGIGSGKHAIVATPQTERGKNP